MTQKEIGKRLRSARQNCDISQEKAAEAIGLPRSAISQIESGKRAVSTLELARLSRLYGVPIASLFSPGTDQGDQEGVLVALYRVAEDLACDAEALRREVARCIELCTEGVVLESALGRGGDKQRAAIDLTAPKDSWEAVEQGIDAASSERGSLGLGTAPIADMAELLSALGIWTSGVRLPDGMSGLFLNHPSIGTAILVNYGHPRGRKRFSYAHEYAHSLMDRDRVVRITAKGNAGELIEKRANAFAASFLMPEEGILDYLRRLDKGAPSREELSVYDVSTGHGVNARKRRLARGQEVIHQDVASIAYHFGVSYVAAIYRLKSLRVISSEETETLLNQEHLAKRYLKLKGRNNPEEQDNSRPRELTSQVMHLAIEAFRRELISRGKMIELGQRLGKEIGLSGKELLEIAEAALSR
jgi:Zn-dependent peptidase ImmA (M78 family)/transcriptional regulator with XRE-family HTH domain